MNYKNLVFTALMAVHFISHGTETAGRVDFNYGMDLNEAKNVAKCTTYFFGSITAALSAKALYHHLKSSHHTYQQSKCLQDSELLIEQHNQKVINQGRCGLQQADLKQQIMLATPLPSDIATIITKLSQPNNWEKIRDRFMWPYNFIYRNKYSNSIQEVENTWWIQPRNKIDLTGEFRLLEDHEKERFCSEKKNLDKVLSNLDKQEREHYLNCGYQHRQRQDMIFFGTVSASLFGVSYACSKLLSSYDTKIIIK